MRSTNVTDHKPDAHRAHRILGGAAVGTALQTQHAEPKTEPDALIREARQRQRRRRMVAVAAGVGSAAVVAGAALVITGGGAGGGPRPPGGSTRPTAPARATRPAPPSGPILAGAATTLVMWPIGYPLFTPTAGPPARLDDLSSGRIAERQIPGIIGCDCRPYLIGVGGRLVYIGSRGITAIRASLSGRPHLLGSTQFFAPSAEPGRVWLVMYRDGVLGRSPVRVRSVPVTGPQAGEAITLPARTELVIRGTSAGFLLQVRAGRGSGLALWRPGSAPVDLPYRPASSPTAGVGDGFDATAHLVAYGTSCRWHTIAANAPHDANAGYRACAMLRVLNVLTGKLTSFAPPPGTAGWVPDGFDNVSAISPSGRNIAAYAAIRPWQDIRTRLYVMQLVGRRMLAVPSSAAFLPASTAWTAKGSWLLYQGHGGHLWAYQVTSARVRASRMRCCRYGMVAIPTHSG